jgi:hypothetical protein
MTCPTEQQSRNQNRPLSYAPWRGYLGPTSHPTACAVGYFLTPFGLSVRLPGAQRRIVAHGEDFTVL